MEITVDAKQPDRRPVMTRHKVSEKDLASPRYNGTGFWPGSILLVGDIVKDGAGSF